VNKGDADVLGAVVAVMKVVWWCGERGSNRCLIFKSSLRLLVTLPAR